MALLTQEMKDMIATQQCFIGTVNADGTPNVAPKRSTRVLTDESLVFTEGTGGATFANVKRGFRRVRSRCKPRGFKWVSLCRDCNHSGKRGGL